MNDTYVTVSGVVATKPRAAVVDGSVPVASFRVASTSRRFDRQSKDWVDGHTTWVTVTCWRTLALNVGECVVQKDRVVVHGRLRTPEWVGEGGVRRTGVEIEAESVGHDLMFGTASFTRRRRSESVEPVGRREADALVREVELDAMSADLATLLGPPEEDELEDVDGDLPEAGPMDGDLADLSGLDPSGDGEHPGRSGRSRRLAAAAR
jgi:single-strand DNA-binding protein